MPYIHITIINENEKFGFRFLKGNKKHSFREIRHNVYQRLGEILDQFY